MDLSQSSEDNVPATTSTVEDRSSEEASAVAQLLEMAQSYQVGHPNKDGDDKDADEEANNEEEDAAPAAEADDNDEAPEKDQYEMSGKEAEFKCHCKYNKGKPCYSRYEKPELMAFRGQYKALNKKELDIAILSKIQTGMHLSPLTCQKKKAHTERKKVRSDHYFHGDKICRDTFCFIHRISHNKLSVLMAHYRGSGICVRVMKRQAAKEKAEALAKTQAKAKRGKGKSGPVKPATLRKRKSRASLKLQKMQGTYKKQRQSSAGSGSSTGKVGSSTGAVSNNLPPMPAHHNDTDAASAMARHIEAMHQYVDIPIGQMPRLSDKRYMDVSRLPETSTSAASQSNHPHHHAHGVSSTAAMSATAGGRAESSTQQTQAQHHHGVWHLPRRPDMQHHEGPYLLPL